MFLNEAEADENFLFIDSRYIHGKYIISCEQNNKEIK